MIKRGHFICRGQVQGVFFRVSAREEALHLALTGWVRNCPDGTVEIVAEGSVESLRDFSDWCAHGPPYAQVSAVDAGYTAATGEFEGFSIRH